MSKKILSLFLCVCLTALLGVSAIAAEFAPSIEAKDAPEVKAEMTNNAGETVVAIIKDSTGKEIASVKPEEIVVTAISQIDSTSASKPELKEAMEKLEDAYEKLSENKALVDVFKDLEKVAKEVKADINVENLAVRDLFDVTIPAELNEHLNAAPENFITLRFDISTDSNKLMGILHNIKGDEWETISNDRITRNADNTVDVKFYSLSPIAFVFDAEDLDETESTATEDNATGWVVIAAVAVVALGAVLFFPKKKADANA